MGPARIRAVRSPCIRKQFRFLTKAVRDRGVRDCRAKRRIAARKELVRGLGGSIDGMVMAAPSFAVVTLEPQTSVPDDNAGRAWVRLAQVAPAAAG